MPSQAPAACPQTPPRKRRRADDPELPPARRRRCVTPPDGAPEDTQEKAVKQAQKVVKHDPEIKKPAAIVLSSPSDVSDVAVLQLRTQQAKKSGLPDLESGSEEKETKEEEKLQEEEKRTENKHLHLGCNEILSRRAARRPPLSRRVVGRSRPRFGVGIVRWWTSAVNKSGWDGEETETDESDSPTSSPCRGGLSGTTRVRSGASEPEVCGCSEEGESAVDVKLEESVGSSVMPIDPSQECFDDSYTADQWQLRSPSPDPLFVPIPSSPGPEETQTKQPQEARVSH